MDVERLLTERFVCAKCGGNGAKVKKLAMTGVGLSRLLDLQHNRYLFASCQICGYTEVYDLRVLEGKIGQGMNVLDFLFG